MKVLTPGSIDIHEPRCWLDWGVGAGRSSTTHRYHSPVLVRMSLESCARIEGTGSKPLMRELRMVGNHLPLIQFLCRTGSEAVPSFRLLKFMVKERVGLAYSVLKFLMSSKTAPSRTSYGTFVTQGLSSSSGDLLLRKTSRKAPFERTGI